MGNHRKYFARLFLAATLFFSSAVLSVCGGDEKKGGGSSQKGDGDDSDGGFFADDDDNNDADGGETDVCETAYKKRSGGSVSCFEPERCDMAKKNPWMIFRFLLKLKTTYKDESGEETTYAPYYLEKNWECIGSFLRGRGVSEISEYDKSQPERLEALATYSQIEPALEFDIVRVWEANCRDGKCEYCSTLSIEECEADIFCAVIEGNKYIHKRYCFYPYEKAGCRNADDEPSGTFEYALDSEGNCWGFNSYVPEGFSTDREELMKYNCTSEATSGYISCN
ncbi:MAG: hypothetical protein Kow0090_16970 [Myxococcota bacterium]